MRSFTGSASVTRRDEDEDNDDDGGGGGAGGEGSTKGIFKSSKTRKLLLRLAVWDIYNEIFLSKNSYYSNYTMTEKINKSKEILIKLLQGQRNYQTKVDLIFPEPIEYWENLINHLRTFENDVGAPPILEMKEVAVPKISKKIKAYTSTDKGLDTIIDCFSDPFTLASELMIQHKLPSDELDYIHGMIQHGLFAFSRHLPLSSP
jgi:hypothetical protein